MSDLILKNLMIEAQAVLDGAIGARAKLEFRLKEAEEFLTPGEDDARYRAAAFEEYHKDGEIEIDDNAAVSKGEDPGAYVAAWVWVPDEYLKND